MQSILALLILLGISRSYGKFGEKSYNFLPWLVREEAAAAVSEKTVSNQKQLSQGQYLLQTSTPNMIHNYKAAKHMNNELLRYLLSNYSKDTQPDPIGDQTFFIIVRLFPIKLLHLYEKHEVLEMTVRFQLSWIDPLLAWEPAQHANQTFLIIANHHLWSPDLQIANSASDLYALLRDQKFDYKVHNDGSVWWHPTGNILTRCELNLEFFPFDHQRCAIILESAIYSVDRLNLTLRQDKSPVSMSMYVESGNWHLFNVTGYSRTLWVTKSTGFTRVEFWLHFGRKTSYFKLNVIFPCCMLSSLQLLTFFFPLESQERVPQATSILLSVIVFQSMINDQLPKSSDSLPLLCIYVAMITCMSVLAVAESVLIAGLISRKNMRTRAPSWSHSFLKFLYRWNTPRVLRKADRTYSLVSALFNFHHGPAVEPSSQAYSTGSVTYLDSIHKRMSDVSVRLFKKRPSDRRLSEPMEDEHFQSIKPVLKGSNSTLGLDRGDDIGLLKFIDEDDGSLEKLTKHSSKPCEIAAQICQDDTSVASTMDAERRSSCLRTAPPHSSPYSRRIIHFNHPPASSPIQEEEISSVSHDSSSQFRKKSTISTSTSQASPPMRRRLYSGERYAAKPSPPVFRRQRRATLFNLEGEEILLDWVYLARLIDALIFVLTFVVVTVIPVVLFGILPPANKETHSNNSV